MIDVHNLATPSPAAPTAPGLELWGGVECTINRVGDAFHEQLGRAGHLDRLDDLDRFAALGLRALRYPLLWEQLAPDGLDRIDWGWADERMARLRDLGVRPIVGLCHHGSGPRGTHLLDPGFAEGLARFARAVAERYPWVDAYTPVNEPLTTARFAALYGYWYPHAADGRSFARALVNQCRAVALSMRAIREVNPAAQLIQTEDLAKTFATPPLTYQADYENDRRWLSLDLLCGRVGPGHPLWAHLWWLGLNDADLAPFREEPCPPDLLGFNYYVTSERFLDHRLERYPGHPHAGNGRDAYADLEAVRVLAGGPAGPRELLREAWERFGRPLAITEAHLGATREEQVRWLAEVWREAGALRAEGVDLRAVTVWSLLGAFDWHCLLTRCENRYEPGAFDVRAPTPRPTAIAKLAADLAAGRAPTHPVLAGPGWWRRPERLLYPPLARDGADAPLLVESNSKFGSEVGHPRQPAAPVLIVGDGAISRAFARACGWRGLPCRVLDMPDLAEPGAHLATTLLDEARPWAVIVTTDPTAATAGNRPDGMAALAGAAAQRGIAFLAVSTALVFDGTAPAPYLESDAVAPTAPAGRRAAARESEVRAAHPGALIVRTGPVFGTGEADDPLAADLDALARGARVAVATDCQSPVFLRDLVDGCLDLLVDGEAGVWHLGQGAISRVDLVRQAAVLVGLDAGCVAARGSRRSPAPNHALASDRGWPLPALDGALERFAWEWRHRQHEQTRSAAAD